MLQEITQLVLLIAAMTFVLTIAFMKLNKDEDK